MVLFENKRIFVIVIYVSLLATLVSGCIFSLGSDKKSDSGKDPAPGIVSVSVLDGDIVTTADIIISWVGNDTAELYQYSLDGEYSDWIDTTSVTLLGLEEAEHLLTLQARADTLFGDIVEIRFTVDIESGPLPVERPGIGFIPDLISDNVPVTVRFYEISSIMAAHIEVVCEDGSALLGDFTPNSLVDGETRIISFSQRIDAARLIIDIGFAGASQGVSGTFDIGTFPVTIMKSLGEIVIDRDVTELRDADNNPITLKGFGKVRIER